MIARKTILGTLGTKNPPVDADLIVQRNSESSWSLFTSTWTQIKAFFKTYFDGIYALITGTTNNTFTWEYDTLQLFYDEYRMVMEDSGK